MICRNCYSDTHTVAAEYDGPDKYEELFGIESAGRRWLKCCNCGHYQSESNYPAELLTYKGYRSKEFRGKTIREQFDDVVSLPNHQRENFSRVNWLHYESRDCYRVLDVGSGLGVFPNELREHGYEVHCVEPDEEAAEFLISLGFDCSEPCAGYDLVTMVHVLEHVQAPILFLNQYKRCLQYHGKLFIEVPDAREFKYLSKNHDEFNSCHLHFFTPATLAAMVEKAGFDVVKIERCFHTVRNLSRIRLFAELS